MTSQAVLICNTSGTIPAVTSTAILDPMTGNAAFLPTGAAVNRITVFRDGNGNVTSGCTIQVGTTASATKYISIGDGITTTLLNSGQVIHKGLDLDFGAGGDVELRIVLNNQLTDGGIAFCIYYSTFE